MSDFGSFWDGTLSPYETRCLASFVQRGHNIVLYSYDNIGSLPKGIQQADAREIVDKSYLHRFITNKQSNVAAFSDYFRYNMFLKTKLIWTDTDIFALKDFEITPDENFFVLEDGSNFCNALLRIERTSPELKEIIHMAETTLDRDVPWAVLQNFTAKTFKKKWGELKSSLKEPAEFMPIHHEEYYKLLLPDFAEECAEKCRDAKTVHLYNNIIDKIGVYKQLLPPEGSYLNRLFMSGGLNSDFCGVYPAAVMRTLVDGWRMRFSGECLTAKTILKQAFPSLARTTRGKIWKYLK